MGVTELDTTTDAIGDSPRHDVVPVAGADVGLQASYVFVVGLPRTGTHLMVDIINASGEARIGGEARFMGGQPRLGLFARPGVLQSLPSPHATLTEAQARQLIDGIYRQVERGDYRAAFWKKVVAEVDREELLRRFMATSRRGRDLLDIGMGIRARGRRIRGDKTPDNVYYVPTLLEWFPGAKVVHMMRDPRDVFASTMQQGWIGPRRLHLPATTATKLILGVWWGVDLARRWRLAAKLDKAYRQRYPDQYLLCRFEDLVADPEPVVRRAAAFLSLPVTESMFERRIKHSSYFAHGTAGFRSEAVARWRRTLHPLLARWVSLLCGAELERHGYPRF